MKTEVRRLPPKEPAVSRQAEKSPQKAPPAQRRKAEGWLRKRRAAMQPWRRGRIRPSTCHDLAGQE